MMGTEHRVLGLALVLVVAVTGGASAHGQTMMMGQGGMPMMGGAMTQMPMMGQMPMPMGQMPMMPMMGGMPMMMGQMPMMPMMGGMPMMMGMGGQHGVDANGDGVIQADEAAEHAEQAFDHFDRDGDEVLVPDEFAFGMPGAAKSERRAKRFATMDADGDGEVTFAEFMKSHEAMQSAADSDGDGKVTVWEYRVARRM